MPLSQTIIDKLNIKSRSPYIVLDGKSIDIYKNKAKRGSITSDQFLRLFADKKNINAQLHPNTIYQELWENDSFSYEMYITYRAPGKQLIRYHPYYSYTKHEAVFYLPHIYLMTMYRRNKLNHDIVTMPSYVYWGPEFIKDLNTVIYPLGLGNIGTDGSICWKTVTIPKINTDLPLSFQSNIIMNCLLNSPFTSGRPPIFFNELNYDEFDKAAQILVENCDFSKLKFRYPHKVSDRIQLVKKGTG